MSRSPISCRCYILVRDDVTPSALLERRTELDERELDDVTSTTPTGMVNAKWIATKLVSRQEFSLIVN